MSLSTAGIKLSCDRHLLSATHANISSGIQVGPIIAVLKALLVLGDSASTGREVSMAHILGTGFSTDDEFGLGLRGGSVGRGDGHSLGELANMTLRQICSQEWVRDRCLQVPDYLCNPGILLDKMLSPQQAQSLLRLICHTDMYRGRNHASHDNTVGKIIRELDEWSLRSSMVDIKLMYHRLNIKTREGQSTGAEVRHR